MDITRRQTEIDGDELYVVENDDPRWIKTQKELYATFAAVDDIACELVDADLNSITGVTALLKYGLEHVEAGHVWPDISDGEGKDAKHGAWLHFAVRNALEALEKQK
ncbi:hypothetical protein IF803_23220 [Bradyrhizobium sp. UFLA06-06]